MIANEQVDAYVGRRWGNWEFAGPPAKPPSGESMCKSVDTALRIESAGRHPLGGDRDCDSWLAYRSLVF
jgi:hypothetical protein